MNAILIGFSRSYNVPEKADIGEKISDIGLGLLRMGFGHAVRVRRVELVNGREKLFFEKKSYFAIQRIAAIAFAILILPITLLLIGVGVLGLALSKSHKYLSERINEKTPDKENLRIHKIIQSQMEITHLKNPTLRISDKQSVIYNRKTKKYVYISEAPPIKNLVISGGGAKGVILLGAFEAFEQHKVGPNISFRDGLDHVAGSSIGAITAALFAAGMTAEDMSTATQVEDFEKLQGKGCGPILKDGKPLIIFLRKNMRKAIRDRLRKKFGDLHRMKIEAPLPVKKRILLTGNGRQVPCRRQIKNSFDLRLKGQDSILFGEVPLSPPDGTKLRIQKVLDALDKPSIEDVKITFSMLKTLHEIDPHGFKELTVTAICRETGKTLHFDADTYPDLDIAIACRASSSLPIVFAPVRIGSYTYSDGGYLDNVPVASMQNKQGKGAENKGIKGQNLQTLALVFDGTGRLKEEQSPFLNYTTKEHTLYNPSVRDRISRNFLAKMLGGISTSENNTEWKERTLELIRTNYAQRNIPLLISINTRDFKKAKELEGKYKKAGYQQASEYLRIHTGELMYRTFDNLDQLSNYVPKNLTRVAKQFFSSKT
jgi:NTE family protein